MPHITSRFLKRPTNTNSHLRDADLGLSELRMLKEGEAATLLGVSVRALQAWRCRGGGPPFVRVAARVIRYRQSDLRTWLASRVCTSTSEY